MNNIDKKTRHIRKRPISGNPEHPVNPESWFAMSSFKILCRKMSMKRNLWIKTSTTDLPFQAMSVQTCHCKQKNRLLLI